MGSVTKLISATFILCFLHMVNGGCNRSVPKSLLGVTSVKAIENSATIRNGFDVVHLYEIKGDTNQLERIVKQLELKECSEPTSFAKLKSPTWWLHGVDKESRKFEYVLAGEEKYRSAWFAEADERIFIEVGQW